MDDWDKSWLVDECHLCDICGRQYIHWNCYPKSYSLPPNSCYDSSIICDVGRGDEVENAKQEARNVNSLMECTDMLDKVNSKIAEQMFECVEEQKIITKLRDALDTIQLEITVLEIATQQKESYEAEIVSQSWLQEQTQLVKFHESIRDGRVELTQEIDQFDSDIHDLETHLNKKIEASDAQLSIVVDNDQQVEQKEKFQPLNYTLFLNIDVEKEYKSENVVEACANNTVSLYVGDLMVNSISYKLYYVNEKFYGKKKPVKHLKQYLKLRCTNSSKSKHCDQRLSNSTI
ncbi:hypothetical protein H5410_054992 [Solanum commersonii]|uniref:Uncharacterized protein n=1 Tax=Solanum commersonii TaxID=4109 RepID=A0A9J5WGX2_SOLCO|nr:hypothetical protein H5410_054992 [Solanum commersonii]